MTERVLTGGCLCGQVRYEARGPAVNVRACHCRICQKVTGAPFYSRAVFPRDAVTRTGETRSVTVPDRPWRLASAACGSPMFVQPRGDAPFIAVSLASLDAPDALAPDMHIWTSSKLAWLKLADGLPQYPQAPPE